MVHWISSNLNLILEIASVIFGIAYILLIAKNKISGWIFGSFGSLISIFLFYRSKLFAEAILYIYYVIAGIQGYFNWNNKTDIEEVYKQNLRYHLFTISIGIILSASFYFLLKYIFPESARPLIDSFTTIFSFIATYLTVKKDLDNWIYWIVIDFVTVYLYFSRELYIYAGLMIAYTVLAYFGYKQWKLLKVTETS